MQRTVHFLVEGRVQGVGYRAWLQREAQVLGLVGWVRNRRTGAVEAVAAGDAASVEALIGACRRGPHHARVDALYLVADVEDASLGTFARFEVGQTL